MLLFAPCLSVRRHTSAETQQATPTDSLDRATYQQIARLGTDCNTDPRSKVSGSDSRDYTSWRRTQEEATLVTTAVLGCGGLTRPNRPQRPAERSPATALPRSADVPLARTRMTTLRVLTTLTAGSHRARCWLHTMYQRHKRRHSGDTTDRAEVNLERRWTRRRPLPEHTTG